MNQYIAAVYIVGLFCLSTHPNLAFSQVKSLSIPDGYSSPEIIRKGRSIPFENYRQWFDSIKANAKNLRALDRFQHAYPPKEVDRLLDNVENHWIEYQSDDLKIAGVLAFPKRVRSEKLPVIIFNRGGNEKTPHTRLSILKLIMPLAEQGYIVLASNYRGSRFSEGRDEFGGKDVNDVLRLIDIVPTIPNADPNRIGMVGWSRGAMMTMLAAKSSDKIKTSVVIAGNYDQFKAVARRPEMEHNILAKLAPAFTQNRENELRARSALFWLDELNQDMPILIMHGTFDWRVDHNQSIELAKALKKAGHPHKLKLFEDGNHGLTFDKDAWQNELYDWFNTML